MGDTLTGQQESDCRATKFNPNLTLTTVLLNTARDRKGLPGKVSRVRVKKHFITLSNIPNNRVYTNDKVMPLLFHSLLMLVIDRHVCLSSLREPWLHCVTLWFLSGPIRTLQSLVVFCMTR